MRKDVESVDVTTRSNGYMPTNISSMPLAELRSELNGLRKVEWQDGKLGPQMQEVLDAFRAELGRRTETALAANGHLMVYRLSPRTGDAIQHSAVCHAKCGACAEGDALPDW